MRERLSKLISPISAEAKRISTPTSAFQAENPGHTKEITFSLVERGGRVRSHHVPSVNAITLGPILRQQIDAASRVMSDEGGGKVGSIFDKHETVNHSIGEYVRGDAHTNTIESYFANSSAGRA